MSTIVTIQKGSEVFVENMKACVRFDYVIDSFMDRNLPRFTHTISFNGKYISCSLLEQTDSTREVSLQMMQFANIMMKNALIIALATKRILRTHYKISMGGYSKY
jgi:hypothetical protein